MGHTSTTQNTWVLRTPSVVMLTYGASYDRDTCGSSELSSRSESQTLELDGSYIGPGRPSNTHTHTPYITTCSRQVQLFGTPVEVR